MEKVRNHVQEERDRAWANLVKAQKAACKLERALLATVQERNSLNGHMKGIGASLAKALEEPVQEYKANFKETDDYLDFCRMPLKNIRLS